MTKKISFLSCLFALFFVSSFSFAIEEQILLPKVSVSKKVDYVIFSYDRPLQLYALLESSEKYFTGLQETHVIYRSSNIDYDKAYKEVFNRFPWAIPHKQSSKPKEDFKPLVLKSVFSPTSDSPYIMFAVDDILVTDFVNLCYCSKALENEGALGFYLRLGKNISFCYMLNKETPVPKGEMVTSSVFRWKFKKGAGDWNYPHTVDMTIYRKSDVQAFLVNSDYANPNQLEHTWAKQADNSLYGLCFEFSKNINLPLNLVNLSTNRCEHLFTPVDLLAKFNQGLKIDVDAFYMKRNISPHVDYMPSFIRR